MIFPSFHAGRGRAASEVDGLLSFMVGLLGWEIFQVAIARAQTTDIGQLFG
jgi:hypothetical protein